MSKNKTSPKMEKDPKRVGSSPTPRTNLLVNRKYWQLISMPSKILMVNLRGNSILSLLCYGVNKARVNRLKGSKRNGTGFICVAKNHVKIDFKCTFRKQDKHNLI